MGLSTATETGDLLRDNPTGPPAVVVTGDAAGDDTAGDDTAGLPAVNETDGPVGDPTATLGADCVSTPVGCTLPPLRS